MQFKLNTGTKQTNNHYLNEAIIIEAKSLELRI